MSNLTGARSNFPDSIDQIMELFTLPANLKTSAQRYQELIIKVNPTPSEVAEIGTLTSLLQQYIIDVEKWNKFGDILINMQNFFKNETEGYIQQKQIEFQSEINNLANQFAGDINGLTSDFEADINGLTSSFQTEINKFQFKGTYNSATQYYKNNVVEFFDGATTQLFLALQDSLNKTPTDTLYWRVLTLQGPVGPRGVDGIGLIFRGAWDSGTSYSANDGVQFGGMLFASLVSSNIGNTPNLSGDTAYWAKVMNATVDVKRLVGVRSIAANTSTVNFIVGDIVSYNPSIDSIEVFANGLRLTKGLDYNIGAANDTIVKTSGSWTAPSTFEIVVTKNMIDNDAVFADGNYILDSSIGLNKLKTEVKQSMVYINSTAPDPLEYKMWIDINA